MYHGQQGLSSIFIDFFYDFKMLRSQGDNCIRKLYFIKVCGHPEVIDGLSFDNDTNGAVIDFVWSNILHEVTNLWLVHFRYHVYFPQLSIDEPIHFQAHQQMQLHILSERLMLFHLLLLHFEACNPQW